VGPLCFDKIRRLIDLSLVNDQGLACLRMLPSRRDDSDDPPEDLFQGQFSLAKQFLDPVEAIEFFCSLLERGEQAADGPGGPLTHDVEPLLCRIFRRQ